MRLRAFTWKELQTMRAAQKLLGAPTIVGGSSWAGGDGGGSQRSQIRPHAIQMYENSEKLFPLYIFRGFCVYCVPLPPLRGQHMGLCHPRWLPTSGLTEFAVCCGGARFEPRTTDLQSGALTLSHHSSLTVKKQVVLLTFWLVNCKKRHFSLKST
jgi:hypothetical protein